MITSYRWSVIGESSFNKRQINSGYTSGKCGRCTLSAEFIYTCSEVLYTCTTKKDVLYNFISPCCVAMFYFYFQIIHVLCEKIK